MSPIEVILLLAVAFIIVRNVRNDKAAGRPVYGGGGDGTQQQHK